MSSSSKNSANTAEAGNQSDQSEQTQQVYKAPSSWMQIEQSAGNDASSSGGQNQQSTKAPSGGGRSGPPSKYSIIKEGWGDRKNFQFSYGLKMTPDDLEEGTRILNMMQQDYEVDDSAGSEKK